MHVEIGTEAAQFLEKEYIKAILRAVPYSAGSHPLLSLILSTSSDSCPPCLENGVQQAGDYFAGDGSSSAANYTNYTVKKGWRFSHPHPSGCR